MPTAQFPEPELVGPRDWGREILLCLSPKNFTLKEIWMTKGKRGGLQKHHLKDEAGVMLMGKMLVRYNDGGLLKERIVQTGDVFHFPTGCVHQTEALTDCAYYEVSTPHFNDRVHVESEFGIEKEEGGLPSTKLEEVELR
jgi:quercetin dioxygenase-like cupin family protein